MDAPEAGYQLGSDAVERERLNRQGMVLMNVPDPAVALRTQATLLRPGPGGMVAPIEFDLGSARFVACDSPGPLAAGRHLSTRVSTRRLGGQLWAILQQAGLRPLGW